MRFLSLFKWVLLTISSIYTLYGAYGQVSYTTTLTQSVSHDSLFIDISIFRQSGSASFDLGTSNFVVNVDTSAINLSSGVILQRGAFDVSNNALYNAMTLGFVPNVPVGTLPNAFNLTVIQNTPPSGTPVTTATMFIGRIAFKIKDCSKTNFANWRKTIPTGNVLDNNGVPIKSFGTFNNAANISLGWSPVTPTTLTVSANPVCASSNVVLTAPAGYTGYQYEGKLSGTLLPVVAISSNSVSVPASSIINGDSIYVRYRYSSLSCYDSTSKIKMTIQPGPKSHAGNDTSICGPGIVSLHGVDSNATGQQWSTSGSGTFTNAAALSTSYIPSTADKQAGSVKLVLNVSGSGGCPNITDTMVVYFPKPSFNPVISGPSTICNNKLASYSTTTKSGYNYNWSLGLQAGSGTSISGASSGSSILVKGGSTITTDTVKVVADSAGCQAGSGTYPVKVFPSCGISANFFVNSQTVDTTVCSGTQIVFKDTIYASGLGNINSWSWNFGPGAVPSTYIGKGPVSVKYSLSGTFNTTLIVTNTAGQADTVTHTPTVKVSTNSLSTPVLNCGSGTCNSVSVTWQPVTGASIYYIRYKKTSGSVAWTTDSTTSLSYTVGPSKLTLAFPDSVFFQIASKNKCVNSGYSGTTFCRVTYCNISSCSSTPPDIVLSKDTFGCVGTNLTLQAKLYVSGTSNPYNLKNSVYRAVWNSGKQDTALSYLYTIPSSGNNIVNFALVDTTSPTCYKLGSVNVNGTALLTSKPSVGIDTLSCSQIVFNWLPVANAQQYKVDITETVPPYSTTGWITPSSGPTGTIQQITGLANNSQRTISVEAVGGCNITTSDTVVSPPTCSCYIGHISPNSINSGCALQPVYLVISNIKSSNWAINWTNPITNTSTGFIVNDSIYQFTPVLPNTTYYVKFVIRDFSSGTACDTKDSIKIVTGTPVSSVWPALQDTFCILDVPALIENASPAGGVYLGTGVITINGRYYFDPSVAGVGNHQITYNNCGFTITKTFYVSDAPCVSIRVDRGFLTSPSGIYSTCDGTTYFSDYTRNAIFKVDNLGNISLVIGDTSGSSSANKDIDGLAGIAKVPGPKGIVVKEGSDEIYFVSISGDSPNHHKVKKYDPFTQQISSVAGINGQGKIPANGVAASIAANTAAFHFDPNNDNGMAWDASSTKIFFIDGSNYMIRQLDLNTSLVNTLVGSGITGVIDGPSLTSRLRSTSNLDADSNYLYIADNGAARIRALSFSSNLVSSLTKGLNDLSYIVDGDSNTSRVNVPYGIATTADKHYYFTDNNNDVVRQFNLNKYITTSAGIGPLPLVPGTDYTPQPGNATGSPDVARFQTPQAMSYSAKGYIDVIDYGNQLIKRFALPKISVGIKSQYCYKDPMDSLYSPFNGGRYYVIKGNPGLIVYKGTQPYLNPSADTNNVIIGYKYKYKFCSDSFTYNVFIQPLPKTSLPDTALTCTGKYLLQTDSAYKYTFSWYGPNAKSVPIAGATKSSYLATVAGKYYVHVTDSLSCGSWDSSLVIVSPPLQIQVLSTKRNFCYSTDSSVLSYNVSGGSKIARQLWNTGDTSKTISALVTGVYEVTVTDINGCSGKDSLKVLSNPLSKVCITTTPGLGYGQYYVSTLAGSITNIAGTTDNVKGTNARFRSPWDVYYYKGALYVTEGSGGRVRKISLSDTLVTTFAGSTSGTRMDSIGLLNANMPSPHGIVADKFGNFYVALNGYVAKLDAKKDSLYVIAGDTLGNSVNPADGYYRNASFYSPQDMDIDPFGNLYLADQNAEAIREINPTTRIVSTYAGTLNGSAGFGNGPKQTASFYLPFGINRDLYGNFLVIEEGNMIAKIDTNGIVSRVVGNNSNGVAGYSSPILQKLIPGVNAKMSKPWGGAISKYNSLYFTDALNRDIRCVEYDYEIQKIAGEYTVQTLAPFDTLGVLGYADGRGDSATFNGPIGVTINPVTGIIYVADAGNNKIRSIYKNKTITICQGANTVLDASCSNGTVTWASPTGSVFVSQGSGKIQVSAAGTYVAGVQNANGCMSYDTVYVKVNPVPVANAGIKAVRCKGDTITLGTKPAATGGTPYKTNKYLYNWTASPASFKFPSGDSLLANPTVALSKPGNYTFTLVVTDSLGCSSLPSAKLVSTDSIKVSLGPNLSHCTGDTFRFNPVVVSGSPLVPIAHWHGPAGISDTTILNPLIKPLYTGTGTYEIFVADSSGCIASDTINVKVRALPKANIGFVPAANDTLKTCPNVAVGLLPVTISSSPALNPAKTKYRWTVATANAPADTVSGTGSTADPSFLPTVSGVKKYYVRIQDDTSCASLPDSIYIQGINTPLIVPKANRDTVCSVGDTTRFTVKLADTLTTGNYKVTWKTISALVNPADSNLRNPVVKVSASPLVVIVRVTDKATNCYHDTTYRLYIQNLTVNAGALQQLCPGDTTKLNVTVTPSTPGLIYRWRPDITLSDTTILQPTVKHQGTGVHTYYLNVINPGNQCNILDSVKVKTRTRVQTFITFIPSGKDTLKTCPDVAVSLSPATVSTSPGLNPVTTKYIWTVAPANAPADTVKGTGSGANPSFLPTVSGVKKYYLSMQDDTSCASLPDSMYVQGVPAPTVKAFAARDTLCAGDTTQLFVNDTISGGAYAYKWKPAYGLFNQSDTTIENPIARPMATTDFIVKITDKATTCFAYDTVRLTTNTFAVSAGMDTTVCLGGTLRLSGSVIPLSGVTYRWKADNTLNDTTILSPVANPLAAGIKKYYLSVVPAICPSKRYTDSVAVTVNSLPVLSPLSNYTTCINVPVVLLASAGGGKGPYSYNWIPVTGLSGANTSSPTATPTITGNTTYTVTVTDANGCAALSGQSVILTAKSVPTASISGGDSICKGGSVPSGDINVNLTGTAPWSLQYTDGATIYAATGITSSPYTTALAGITKNTIYSLVSVSDSGAACAGMVSGNADVIVRDSITASISGSLKVCSGKQGDLTFLVTGNLPLTVSYTANGVDQTPLLVTSNPYTIKVSPTITTAYVITGITGTPCPVTINPAAFNMTVLALTDPLCNCNIQAAITGGGIVCSNKSADMVVNITGGTAPYTIVYTDGTNTDSVINITGSTYNLLTNPSITTTYQLVEVKDAFCASLGSGTATFIVPPGVVTGAMAGYDTIWPGDTANIQLTFTGTPPWSVSYTDGINTYVKSNIIASPYLLRVAPTVNSSYNLIAVTDKYCAGSVSGTANVFVRIPVTATLAGADSICLTKTYNAKVAFSGTGPYSLTYNLAGTVTTVNNISNQIYTISYTPASAGGFVVALVSASGPGGKIGSLTGGPINVSVLDTSNALCKCTASATISSDQVLCQGAPVSFPVNIIGSPTVNVTFSDGTNSYVASYSSTGNQTFTPNPAPTATSFYFVTKVQDATCSAPGNGSLAGVVINPVPTVSISLSSTYCPGQVVYPKSVITPNGVYAYTWTGAVASSLPAPSFPAAAGQALNLTIKDQHTSCSASASASISVSAISKSIPSLTSCVGNPVTLNASVSGFSSPSFRWKPALFLSNDSTLQPVADISSPGSFGYTLYITAANGQCADSVKTTVTVTKGASITLIDSLQVCSGIDTMLHSPSQINIVPSPSTSITNITWSPTTGITAGSTTANPTFLLTTGSQIYQVTVKDNNNCTVTDQFKLISSPFPSAVISGPDFGCNPSPSITWSVPEVAGYTYQWTNLTTNATVSAADSLTINAPLSSITYFRVKVTTPQNCFATAVKGTRFLNPVTGIQVVSKSVSCGNTSILLNGSVANGDSVSYVWSTNGKGSFVNSFTPVTNYLPNQLLDISQVVFELSASNYCTPNPITAFDTVRIKPTPYAAFVAHKQEDFVNKTITFTNNSVNANKYTWYFGDGGTSTVISPSYTYANPGDFKVVLIATNDSGCTDTDTVLVDIIGSRVVYVPNAFEPANFKPENASLRVFGTNIKESGFLFQVYSRWGDMLYSTDSFNEANTVGWPGTDKSGKDMSMGVYTYVLKGVFYDGTPFSKSGTATLIR